MNESEIRERIQRYSNFPAEGKIAIVTDTTEFMRIDAGDVLELEGGYYLVRGDAVEGRFGLDRDPKYWVKRATDLSDGSFKFIKLVFHETFVMHLGVQPIQCFRSPRKEARILEKTRNDPFFMQGFNVRDGAGNVVRIIEKIQGPRYLDFILNKQMDHETFFRSDFPGILDNVVHCIEAIGRLHAMGELHGDVRNDHLLINRQTGTYSWIDFDYTYEWSENPFGVDLFGLGNVLLLTCGKGFHLLRDLSNGAPAGSKLKSGLTASDFSLFFPHRIINLQKLFPYIPDSLNQVLLRFSQGSDVFYETTEELLNDLRTCTADLSH